MATMTLSNHVAIATSQGDTLEGWMCIERIIWRGATDATHLMKVQNYAGTKSVLEEVRAGSTTEDREIPMHGHWTNGLKLTTCESLTEVQFILRQT